MSTESYIKVKFESGQAVGDLELCNVDWGQMLIASDAISRMSGNPMIGVEGSDVGVYFSHPGSVHYTTDAINMTDQQLLIAAAYLKLEGERYCILAVNTAEHTMMQQLQIAEQRRLELPS